MINSSPNYKRTKLACYSAYFTMSSIFSLPPLLFITLRNMYNISYTLLGTLVLINFCTQLIIDLIFTFFSKKFNVAKVVKIMPLITSLGLGIYAVVPTMFPSYAYTGLVIGTLIFSVSAGLSEVLLSPIIAAIPSDNPQKDMSTLHSLYAFGFFFVVVVASLALHIFGSENWIYITLFFAVLPIISAIQFMVSPFPPMSNEDGAATAGTNRKNYAGLFLCICCIFFGSCAENTMANWISSYAQNALGIAKTIGDIFGMSVFAVLLGCTRILYGKYGKNIYKVLLTGMIGSVVCYVIAGLSANNMVAFVACVLIGPFSAMLWPGTLLMMEENLPGVGVAAYAVMAASGDMGASVAPQLMGIVIDKVSASDFALKAGEVLNISAEQVGLKTGMLITAIFPLIGAVLVVAAIRYFKNRNVGTINCN